jgi:transcriptional regulator with GAF, ATPase, and Fis domain
VKQGLFRADLFYRLNVFPIVNPPLRDRKEDIPLLVKHFVNRFNAKANKRVDVVPRRAMQALETYQWPGNIRELENIIERAVVLSTGNRLEIGDWFAGLSQRAEPTDETETSDDFETMEENERRHILAALRRTKGRVTGPQGAGRLLDINDKTLQSRMRKLGISRQHLFE